MKASVIPYDPNIEIVLKKRLKRENGKTGNIRISLIWEDRNDLDLSVITPSKELIYFGNKKSKCGGELDVDMNVGGETSKPIENIFWPIGKAPDGRYEVYVENYMYHEKREGNIKYIVEVCINEKSKFFKGSILGLSQDLVCAFKFKGSGKCIRKTIMKS